MPRGRRGRRGPSAHHRSIVQGSDGLTINGGTYANGDASTTIQYNFLVVNINNSPSLTVSVPNAVAFVGLFGYPGQMFLQWQGASSTDASENSVFARSRNLVVNGGEFLYARRDVSKVYDHSVRYYQVNFLIIHFNSGFHQVGFLWLNPDNLFKMFYILIDIIAYCIVGFTTFIMGHIMCGRDFSNPCKLQDCPWFYIGWMCSCFAAALVYETSKTLFFPDDGPCAG
ncbi:hypothetical protein BKA70DRAFT_1435809 [Coprinopsis sp. MPI-PUGE-AT-0042]|nr:hypothetical protein BKA70DRAFT_1435809 [Coprinopsis sp. MPI-PUGE-AT-0042]